MSNHDSVVYDKDHVELAFFAATKKARVDGACSFCAGYAKDDIKYILETLAEYMEVPLDLLIKKYDAAKWEYRSTCVASCNGHDLAVWFHGGEPSTDLPMIFITTFPAND